MSMSEAHFMHIYKTIQKKNRDAELLLRKKTEREKVWARVWAVI